jgi:hypothetical protein
LLTIDSRSENPKSTTKEEIYEAAFRDDLRIDADLPAAVPIKRPCEGIDAESVLKARGAALVGRDLEAIATLFTEDAIVVTSSGRLLIGKEQIRVWVQDQVDRQQREEARGRDRCRGINCPGQGLTTQPASPSAGQRPQSERPARFKFPQIARAMRKTRWILMPDRTNSHS